jgi:hypothetical protein
MAGASLSHVQVWRDLREMVTLRGQLFVDQLGYRWNAASTSATGTTGVGDRLFGTGSGLDGCSDLAITNSATMANDHDSLPRLGFRYSAYILEDENQCQLHQGGAQRT